MKAIDCTQVKAHVLFCINERESNKSSCAKFRSEDFYMLFKERVKSLGLNKTLWVTRTRCLGYCNAIGGVVAIHRPGKLPECYTGVGEGDLEAIWQSFTEGVEIPASMHT